MFLAVARSGSLSGAALSLSIGVATVSRRIERLERRLGRPLFLRHHTGYQLTEEGSALIERAEEMEAAARAFASGLTEAPDVSGTVRLATAENLATVLIVPARGHVSLQRLGTLGYGLYAAQGYVQEHAGGASVDLDRDAMITWAEGYGHLPAAQWIERALRGRAPAIVTTSLATQVSACSAGLGLAVLPHFLAQQQNLICLDRDLGIDQPIWLVTQSDLVTSRRVQAVAEFLRGVISEYKTALCGNVV
ncbi:LysR family transcriptional regulator [Fulvimarina sp. MAC3]|uniref:LysR family transcriptional regulator n=1 Tax=Fulvimarina sp. MAC3 TaxID=3148887 RepID=UPI0031FC1F41